MEKIIGMLKKTGYFFRVVWALIISAKGTTVAPAGYLIKKSSEENIKEIQNKKEKIESKIIKYPEESKINLALNQNFKNYKSQNNFR